MKRLGILLLAIMAVLLVSTGVWLYTLTAAPIEVAPGQQYLEKLFSAGNKTFYCLKTQGEESACELMAQSNGEVIPTGLITDFDGETTNIKPNPSGTMVAVVTDREVVLLDPATLATTTAAVAAETEAFGRYTEFPSFIAEGTWQNDTIFVLPVYPADTPMNLFTEDGTVTPNTVPPLRTELIQL